MQPVESFRLDWSKDTTRRLRSVDVFSTKSESLIQKLNHSLGKVPRPHTKGYLEFHTSLDCLNKANLKRLKALESDALDSKDYSGNNRTTFAQKYGKLTLAKLSDFSEGNLMASPQFRKYMTLSKGDIVLFTFFKGKQDADFHVSVNEDFRFKCLVFSSPKMKDIDFIFKTRSFGFSYKNSEHIPKFYV